MNIGALFGSDAPRRGPRGEVLPDENEGPPDSYRPAGLCPRCGKQSTFAIVGSLTITFEHHVTGVSDPSIRALLEAQDRVTALVCRHCRQGVSVIEEQWTGETPWRKRTRQTTGNLTHRGIHWWPLPEAKLSSDVPEPIADAFVEAVTALYAHCPRAAAVMARRTLEAIAADKGEHSGSLAERLKVLATKGILQTDLAAWATEVRLVGNAGAHFDPLQAVSEADAKQLLSFLRELLRYFYELPAELRRRRQPAP